MSERAMRLLINEHYISDKINKIYRDASLYSTIFYCRLMSLLSIPLQENNSKNRNSLTATKMCMLEFAPLGAEGSDMLGRI